MVGRTSTGRTSDADGGRRPLPRPGEAGSTPPSLNRQWEPVRLPPRRRASGPGPLLPLSLLRYPIGRHLRCRWAVGQGSGPARRRARCQAQTKIGTGTFMLSLRFPRPSLGRNVGRVLPGGCVRQGEEGSYPPSPFNLPRDASDQGDRGLKCYVESLSVSKKTPTAMTLVYTDRVLQMASSSSSSTRCLPPPPPLGPSSLPPPPPPPPPLPPPSPPHRGSRTPFGRRTWAAAALTGGRSSSPRFQKDSPSAAPGPFFHARIFLKLHTRLLHRFRYCIASRSIPRRRQYDATAAHFGSDTATAACTAIRWPRRRPRLSTTRFPWICIKISPWRAVPAQMAKFFESDMA